MDKKKISAEVLKARMEAMKKRIALLMEKKSNSMKPKDNE